MNKDTKKDSQKTVIQILQQNNGEYVSGEIIAQRAQISRSAVWKIISKLKTSGFAIDGVKNKGYRLINNGDILNKAALEQLLCDLPISEVDVRQTVTSTNKLLKVIAEKESISDYLMVAHSQTDGVGRYNRKFFSPSDSGIYFSLLLRPVLPIQITTNLTVAMAVAVALAIEEFTDKICEIKWVNDLLVDGKKVCGILTEGSIDVETLTLNYAVVGVGVNLYKPIGGFDYSIKDIAGEIALPNSLDKNKFLACILKNFYVFLQDLTSPKLFENYSKRLAFVGRTVDILKNGKITDCGVVEGVNKAFKLLVRTSDGVTQSLDSGEISARLCK